MGEISLFDNWFVYNYQRLRNVVGHFLNEDAFHDAYLVMKREVVLSEIATENFEPYFFGVYKKCRLRCIHRDSRYCFPDNEHFFLLMKERKARPSKNLQPPTNRYMTYFCLSIKNIRRRTMNFSA